jgi:hypothetical protein
LGLTATASTSMLDLDASNSMSDLDILLLN